VRDVRSSEVVYRHQCWHDEPPERLGKVSEMADDRVPQKMYDTPFELLYWATAVGLSEEELKKLLARAMVGQVASVPRR
jgi:hypothetical protein